jgi:hypothetical protein
MKEHISLSGFGVHDNDYIYLIFFYKNYRILAMIINAQKV